MVKIRGPLGSHDASGSLRAPPIYSKSLINRQARIAPPAPPPPPAFDLLVSGTLTPDATGNYNEAGIYNGQPYYARTDSAFTIWWYENPMYGIYIWTISEILGDTFLLRWNMNSTPGNPPTGIYSPSRGATGTATVALP